jgi:phytanoyl-CoA hydroxylase
MECTLEATNLTKVQSDFKRDGFFLAKGLFKDQINPLEASFDRIVKHLEGGKDNINAVWAGEVSAKLQKQYEKDRPLQIIHTHNVHRYDPLWIKAFMDPHFLEYSTAILGEDIILHHSKLFLKPARFGGAFPIHQDYSYFSTEKDSMIAAVIHLSDGANSMGGLRLFPGSHKLGRLEASSGQVLNQKLLDEYPLENSVSLDIEAGDVLFFHYFTLHGSLPNLSDTPRKTVLVQMYSGHDQMENGKGHIDEKIALQGFNHRMTRPKAGD